MSNSSLPPKQALTWLLCLALAVGGIGIAYHALSSFSQASVIVEWSTATELNTVGFNLLRSEQPDGPFEQLNPQLIPASDNPYSGGSYSFEDQDTQRGQTYYYLLHDIESTGQVNQYGPIVIEARNNNLLLLLLAGLLLASAGILGWQAGNTSRLLPVQAEPAADE